jgi:Sulfotransferase family
MIISHKHRFVFVHNPKAAGSAIRKAISHLHDDGITYWHQRFVPELDRVVDAAHLTLHDIAICRPDIMDYTFFTVVRETMSRFASAWCEHLRQHPDSFGPPGSDINEWVAKNMDETNFRFNWKYVHFCPQHYFSEHSSHAKRNHNPTPVIVLKKESLDYDWAMLKKKIPALNGVSLPRERVRPDSHLDVLASVSQTTLVRVLSLYAADHGKSFHEEAYYTTHCENINGIHSPYLRPPMKGMLSPGEQIAYEQVLGTK